eukprot:COSAG02_NODE_16125_length_1111_cov_1.149209_1_plen_265_part_10
MLQEEFSALLRRSLHRAHCQRLQIQTFAAGMMFSGSDSRKFEEIHTKMSRCIEMISMVASVSTNAMVACKFEQGKQREQAQAFLDSSDQLLLAATDAVKDEVVRSRKELQRELTQQLDVQGVKMAQQHDVMSQQVEKLTTMLQTVIAMKAASSSDKENPGLDEEGGDPITVLAEPVPEDEQKEEPVKMMECDAARVRKLMEELPMAAKEGERREVLNKVFGERAEEEGEREDIATMYGDEELRALVNEAAAEFNVPGCWIGAVDD